MSTRTILSPGVEVRERDLSIVASNNVGTSVFVTGFANQGPSDEVLKITTRDELELIYGTPTNSAERYFYHTIRELLNSPANIYTSRLPYGTGAGSGFATKYSALVYPGVTVTDNLSSVTASFAVSAGTYVLGRPTHMELTADQYESIIQGSAFTWMSAGSNSTFQLSSTSTGNVAITASNTGFTTLADLGKAAVVLLNKSQTAISDQFEGYYVGLGDNFNLNPGNAFRSIVAANTLNTSSSATSSFVSIPSSTLQFRLTADVNGASNSISQVMENLTDYQLDETKDADVLNIGVFKLRKSLFSTESFKLDYVLDDKIVGSIDYFKTVNDENGGPAINYFLESMDEDSRNVTVLVNDFISNRLGTSSIGVDGVPRKKIRVLTQDLVTNNNQTTSGINTSTLTSLTASYLGTADSLFPLGAYTGVAASTKSLGDIPTKLDRALDLVRNDDIYELDVVVEAGLGTIFAAASGAATSYYDETNFNTTLATQVSGLRTTGTPTQNGETLRNNYMTIFNKFANFCEPGYLGGGRGDCIFIADPLRHIFVTGTNNKVAANKNSIYQRDIYWALRHLFANANTSYAATYANWSKTYDPSSGQQVWVPFSGYAAAAYARTDAARFPWIAPAGFTNGLVTNVLELASTPNQKQRDELYKANINPVAFFPAQGNVIYGQKTLNRKPSAFDRINVRRLFLALERPSKKLSQFFVFEPNTTFTRTRLVNALVPIFDRAKNTEGVYDYLIVCDERNNTPQVIDNNELVVDFYIKPVRASEFILLNFVATRTDTNFQEIIGG